MIIASAAFAAGGLGLLALSLAGDGQVPILLPLATLVLAGVLYASRSISAFIRVLIGLIAAAHVILGVLLVGGNTGLLPAGLQSFVPPISMPVAAGIFAAIMLGVARIPVIRTITHLTDPYFETRDIGTVRIWPFGTFRMPERWSGIGLMAVVVAFQFTIVAISVRLSYFNRDWFNAIQNKDGAEFWRLLFYVWAPWVVIAVAMSIYQYALRLTLQMRWRTWLTEHYTTKWLGQSTHYRMQILGGQTDNPDQRISEDINKFTQTTLALTIGILSQVSTLVSFSVILWTISAGFTLPGTDIVVPGLMFWVALIYAVIATYLTNLIGRPLINLSFMQERYEADFRFSLARLREYGEQVALLDGERTERQRLRGQFSFIIDNFFRQVGVSKRLIAFTSFYEYSNSVVPFVIAAPFYFAGKIPLGVMTQTASAFGRVQDALSYFITTYQTLADYKAVVDRLTSFEGAIARARRASQAAEAIAVATHAAPDIRLEDLGVGLPDGTTLVRAGALDLAPGESALVAGPSGTGKSTLFRAISGIWPFGRGKVVLPEGAEVMLLPQRPYIPIGTLRSAVAYPSADGVYDDADIAEALRAVKLPHLADQLDIDRNWPQTLSLGEQQRLALARALLARPDWLLLDEATAAMDEPTEAEMYAMLRRNLPDTTVVSIGHRSTLAAFHDRRIEMKPGEDGLYEPVAVPLPMAAQ